MKSHVLRVGIAVAVFAALLAPFSIATGDVVVNTDRAGMSVADARRAIGQIQNADTVTTEMQYGLYLQRLSGQRQRLAHHFTVGLRRPDQFTLRFRSGMPTASLVLNDSLFAAYTNVTYRCVTSARPDDVQDMWRVMLDPRHDLRSNHILDPLAAVFGPREADAPLALEHTEAPEPMHVSVPDEFSDLAWFRIRQFNVAEVFNLDAMPTDGYGSIRIAIEPGDPPRLRRIFVDLSPDEHLIAAYRQFWADRGMPKRHQRDARVMHSYFDFRNWRFNEPIDDELFYPGLKEEYAEVDHFMELLDPRPLAQIRETRPEQREPGGSPTQLVGEPAPDVELSNLDGDSINVLDEHAGEVVILDFWATWCPPCLRAIPDLLAVSDEYADQGVVFYAVNVREGELRIRPLLDARNWDLPVLLDSAGDVSHAYRADALPTTVIIGRDGVVRHVHVGAGSSYREHLTAALEQVLAD